MQEGITQTFMHERQAMKKLLASAVIFLLVTTPGCGGTRRSFEKVCQAVLAGDVETVKTIVEKDPSCVNSRDANGLTPLHCIVIRLRMAPGRETKSNEPNRQSVLATHDKHEEIAELLLAHGAKVNAKDSLGYTPLHLAVRNGHKDVAEVLLAHGADADAKGPGGMTPLHIAAHTGNQALARVLLAKGANADAKEGGDWTPLYRAVSGNHEELVEILLSHGANVHAKTRDGFLPLFFAESKGIAELLLAHGAGVESRGYEERTPLHQAAMMLRKDVVELLLDRRANVNALDSRGLTPLLMTIGPAGTDFASKASNEITKILLINGADANARDKEGKPPLHRAVSYNRKDLVTLLLDHGAEIDATDRYQYTALHWAVSQNQKEMVELLLIRGASVNVKNSQRETPLDLTWGGSGRDKEIAELLRRYGGTGKIRREPTSGIR